MDTVVLGLMLESFLTVLLQLTGSMTSNPFDIGSEFPGWTTMGLVLMVNDGLHPVIAVEALNSRDL